jgi:hypothetical protein
MVVWIGVILLILNSFWIPAIIVAIVAVIEQH